MVHVDNCCSARTGANMIGMLYGIIAFYLLVATVDYTVQIFRLSDNEDAKRYLAALGLATLTKLNFLGLKSLKVAFIVTSAVHASTYVASALLVIGVSKGDRRLLLPWILHSITLLIVYIIFMLIAIAVSIAVYGAIGFLAVIAPAIVILVLWALFITIVNKHYTELTEMLQAGDIVRKNSAAREDNGNTSTPQGVSYLQEVNIPRINHIDVSKRNVP